MSDSPLVIHLVDDDEAIRRSATYMLRTSGYVVKTYGSGTELLDQPRDFPAGCILLDIRMPDMDGLEVQAALKAQNILLPVIIITGHADVDLAVRAMKGGAIDFIEKPFEKRVLVDAIDKAFERIERSDRRHARADEARARLEVLTARERDVLQGLVRGHPNKTIAYDLGISPRTVEIHRANLMAKLEVASLSEALRLAFTAGLDEEEGDEA
jgi:two-component system response regulator FixJ